MKQSKLIQRFIISAGLLASLMFGLVATPALAASPASPGGCDSSTPTLNSGISCGAPSNSSTKSLFGGGDNLFRTIANTLIFIIGAIAVIMIIVGALRYTLSAGSPQATAGAKDTILYAVIGLIVAILAFAIVQFVVNHIK